MRRNLLVSAILAVTITAVYLPTLGFEFIHLDDPAQVWHNPDINQGLTADGFRWAFGINHWAWHPLTFVSHMIDSQLFGVEKPADAGAYSLMGPGGHHLTNLLIHVANAIILLFVMYRMTGAFWPSVAAAALFALHPLRVESVAWVTERKDVLSTLFGLLAIWAYVHYAQKPGVGRYLVIMAMFALSLMSKAMLVTLPFALLLLDYWPLRRFRGFGAPKDRLQVDSESGESGELESGESEAEAAAPASDDTKEPSMLENTKLFPPCVQRGVGALILEKLPLLGLTLASIGLTLWAAVSRHAVASLDNVSYTQRLANVPVSYAAYLKSMFWPMDLGLLYPYPDAWPVWVIAGSAAVMLLVTAVSFWQLRLRPYLLIGWFWFLGTLVPVIGLVQAGGQARADRFTYVPMIGIGMMVVWLVASWVEPLKPKMRVVVAGTLVGIMSIGLASLSVLQVKHWQGSEQIYQYTLEVTRDNWKVHSYMARWASGRDNDRALKHFERVLEIKPDRDDVHHSYIKVLVQTGQIKQGLATYHKWIQERPDDPILHFGLGLLLDNAHKPDAALAQYEQALRLDPSFIRGRYTLARHLWAVRGKTKQAETQLLRVLKDDPLSIEAMHTLGELYAREGDFKKADQILEKALRDFPHDALARVNLARVRAMQGKYNEAISLFEKAWAMAPKEIEPFLALARSLVAADRLSEARKIVEKVLEKNPKNPQTHETYAVVLRRLDLLTESARHYEKRIELGIPDPDIHNALGVVLIRLNRPSPAAKQFNEALKFDPDHQQAKQNLQRVKQLWPNADG
jgi:Flp pilus assembly protein TadD